METETAAKAIAFPAKSLASRIVGIDVARALAMFGMTVVHYVRTSESGEFLDTFAMAMRGRAMPLFMLLGGVGVTLAATRSRNPDRDLLVRAVLLLFLGMALDANTVRIAIVLQSYGLFFVAAVGLRRLPKWVLLGLVVTVPVAGAWTYQTIGQPRRLTPYTDLFDPGSGAMSLVFDGYYPFFPVAAFFIFGMFLGRLDLRSSRVAATMASVGAVVGLATIWLAKALIEVFDVNTQTFGARTGLFDLGRLLNTEGHSQMLAWVVSSGATSVAVLGLSILLAPKLGKWLAPVTALGTLALSYYVYQAVLTRWVADPSETTLNQEFFTVVAIYLSFMAFAFVWKLRFRHGPLEKLLRVDSWRLPTLSQG